MYARWGQITHSATFASPVGDEYDPPGQQMPLLHGVLEGVTDAVAPNEREDEGDNVGEGEEEGDDVCERDKVDDAVCVGVAVKVGVREMDTLG